MHLGQALIGGSGEWLSIELLAATPLAKDFPAFLEYIEKNKGDKRRGDAGLKGNEYRSNSQRDDGRDGKTLPNDDHYVEDTEDVRL